MSGKPGRSGRRPRPLADHLADGTYRPTRHGPIPFHLRHPPEDPGWSPSPSDVAGLGEAGRQLLTTLLAPTSVNAMQGVLLLQAAATADALVAWRPHGTTNPTAARLVDAYTKTLAALLAQARVS